MAISPLALGIGLQGKYDYKHQAMLDLSRERGRAKAEAAEEAGKEKKRAEIRKMIVNIRPQGLLPVHEKEINDGVADLLNYAMDNPEDFAGVTQGVHKLESRSLAAKEQSKLINSLSRQSYFEGDKDALQIVMSTNDPAVLEENLSMLPTNIKYDKATSNLAVLNSKYKNTPTRIDEILSKGGDRYAQLTGEEEVIDVNGKKFIQRKFKPEVVDVALNDMLIGDNLQSSNDDYYTELKRQKIALPNLRTDEGRKEFADGRDAFLRKQITDDLSRRELLLNVTPSKGINITNNMGNEMTEPATLGGSGSKNLEYAADPGRIYHATGLAGNALGNHDGLFAYTNRTFDMTTGNPINEVGSQNSTFNQIDAFYTLDKDIKYRGIPFKKGMIIPDEYVNEAISKGLATVEILALGKEKVEDGISFYVPMTEVEQTRYMNANKSERPLILEAQRKQNEAVAKLKQKQLANPTAKAKPTPAPAPKPKPTPAPPAKAKQPAQAKPANAAAAKPPAKVKVKTAEEQANDKIMKELMNGK